MTDLLLIAYLAGIIDADGCIAVRRSTYAARHGNGKGASFWERVTVKQVEPDAVDLLHETFGGSRRLHNPSAKNGRPLHGWEATGRVANAALAKLYPYLLIKKEQAANCLMLRAEIERSKLERVAVGRGHVGAAPRSPRATEAMEVSYLRSRHLNTTGRR